MKRIMRWRRIGRIIGWIAIVGFVCVLSYWAMRRAFTIRNVEVAGDGISIEIDASRLPGNLLFFPVDQISKELLDDYPLAGSVNIRKKYPDTIVIIASVRTPFVIAGTGDETYILDDEGVVLTQYPSGIDLPVISLAMPPLPPGKRVTDEAILSSISFIRLLMPTMRVFRISGEDATSLRAQTDTMSIVFSRNADIPLILRTLQQVITGFRIKGSLPKTVDLRFNKPVVTF
jgi:hypothetical protein